MWPFETTRTLPVKRSILAICPFRVWIAFAASRASIMIRPRPISVPWASRMSRSALRSAPLRHSGFAVRCRDKIRPLRLSFLRFRRLSRHRDAFASLLKWFVSVPFNRPVMAILWQMARADVPPDVPPDVLPDVPGSGSPHRILRLGRRGRLRTRGRLLCGPRKPLLADAPTGWPHAPPARAARIPLRAALRDRLTDLCKTESGSDAGLSGEADDKAALSAKIVASSAGHTGLQRQARGGRLSRSRDSRLRGTDAAHRRDRGPRAAVYLRRSTALVGRGLLAQSGGGGGTRHVLARHGPAGGGTMGDQQRDDRTAEPRMPAHPAHG